MQELKIFENEEFGQVRTTKDEKGNVLFGAIDIANALGYAKARNAVNQHCRYALKQGVPHPQNKNKQIEMLFIPESDVYRLIIKSKLPTAEKFEKWVFEEVLPSIRKHGAYFTEDKLREVLSDPKSLQALLLELLNEVTSLRPKADYFDKMMDSELLINFRDASKEIGVKPLYFIHFLLDKKYLYRDSKKVLKPYQKYIEQGLFEMIEFIKNGHQGVQTLLTPNGRNHFLQLYLDGEMEAGSVANTDIF